MKILCFVACVLGMLSLTAAVRSSCMPDLGLVVDTTKSLKESNIPKLKELLSLLVKEFDISENKTHVSLETFNGKANVHNKFNDPNYWSVDAVLDLINTSIAKLKSPTRLDYALEKANGTMFTEENGYRPGERNVMLLVTDGRTHEDTDLVKYEAYLKALKSKGVRIVVVAIGPDSEKKESQQLLNQTGGENVIYTRSYPNLREAVDDVVELICRADGGFSDWSDWSDCKDGMQERTRTCTNPPPQGKGEDCEGEPRETRPCVAKRSSRIGRISAIDAINLEETNEGW